MVYKVKLNAFEGPFDLLVYLIENAKMSIYDIEVSQITKQYLAYLETMKQLEISLAADFLVLAATLVEIKSKMLLPRVGVDFEDGIFEEDPRSELVERLLEYKKFKDAAEKLEVLEDSNIWVFAKPKEDISVYTDNPDEYLSLDMNRFVAAFKLFLSKKQRVEEVRRHYTRVEKQRETGENKIRFIKEFFAKVGRSTVKFRELFTLEKNSKYEVVLTFSSLLEMARQKSVKLKQAAPFGEISITALKGEAKDKEGERDSEQ